ncbi:MAG: hypothetical protein P0Y53_00255 [Candidatus Pseudobacter hemicellulosilyticus]|uniref:Uncharacterized protein n=1 Tax=Candidatus Pseudobacter hemicellulosilyticus TaxID=3121375 RepID=A0AAJ6BFQ7_9BACT|nr:MAG: hypothetical protein P0Y53_00255 [Pseudobacter sp.]
MGLGPVCQDSKKRLVDVKKARPLQYNSDNHYLDLHMPAVKRLKPKQNKFKRTHRLASVEASSAPRAHRRFSFVTIGNKQFKMLTKAVTAGVK